MVTTKRSRPDTDRRAINRVTDALIKMLSCYLAEDRADGSPDPVVTAMARLLSNSLSFVRVGLAHAELSSQFDLVLQLARERETEGWEDHRANCPHCGGH